MPLSQTSAAAKNDDEGVAVSDQDHGPSVGAAGGTEAKAGNGHGTPHVNDGQDNKKDEDEGVQNGEDDDEEDEEDEEPSLKYERIVGAIPDLLRKDSASALAIVNRTMALGTHGGIVHILDLTGKRLKSYKPHMASIVDISVDATGDFVATASIDGHVVIHSLSTTESYAFDMKRPMRTVAMEPNFGKRNTRAFVCGGLSGNLVLRERGWLGHKETVLNAGEGPIWQVRWGGKFIAWADDFGVKIYDTSSQTRFATIDRLPDSPRADLFKCTLYWQDDTTLLIGWANTIKVARIRARQRTSTATSSAVAKAHPYHAEIVAFFKLDSMLSGIAAHPLPNQGNNGLNNDIHNNNGHNSNNNLPSTPDPISPIRQPSPTRTNTSSIFSGHKSPIKEPSSGHSRFASAASILSYTSSSKLGGGKETMSATPSITAFLVVAYTPPETFNDEMTDDRAKQARKAAERPELRVISRAGEELVADALSLANYQSWACNDYALVEVDSPASPTPAATSSSATGVPEAPSDAGATGKCYVVLSPRDLVLVKPRDRRDHVAWLVERKRYEEALEEAEVLEFETAVAAAAVAGSAPSGLANGNGTYDEKKQQDTVMTAVSEKIGQNGAGETKGPLSSAEIGQMYIEYLIDRGDFDKAASLLPKVCGKNVKRWEDWIFSFAEQRRLQAVIPYVPVDSPTLDRVVYDMILAHFLAHDHQMLLQTIKEWSKDLYDVSAVILAVRAELDKASSFPFSSKLAASSGASASSRSTTVLMGCLAELYFINRQPGKALPYYLRLRRPNVFDLIKENNLFTDVSDQVLLLVEFDNELMMKKKEEGKSVDESKSEAIALLVNNVHSIPITKVVQQLLKKPYYLFLYLDALVSQDAYLVSDFADLQVKLYAEYATPRLVDFLRASNYYNLEQAFEVCKERDLVLEMVFLLGKMGNNKQALTLIIERLGDVHRAIDFAKEQNDDDLWEDLLRYSETRPMFIRGLLENVGVEISPIRLIRRIKNGLEIPGLKDALIKILQDFHLQISLLEGCQTILNGDSLELSRKLQRGQTSGFFLSAKTRCQLCSRLIQDAPRSLIVLYLCRHVVHASCLRGSEQLPSPPDPAIGELSPWSTGRDINGRIAYESIIRARVGRDCPMCDGRSDDERT